MPIRRRIADGDGDNSGFCSFWGKFLCCFLVFFFLSGFLTADTGKGFSLQFLPQYKGRRRYSRSGEGSSKIRLKGGLDEGRELGLLRLQIPLRFNHSRGWPEKRAS